MRASRAADTAVDVLAPLLLTAVALWGWSTTYDGSRWLLTGVGGAGLGALLAWWLNRRGWGADLLFVLLIPAYLVTAAPVSGIRLSGSLAQELITDTLASWSRLAGSHPPVPDAGAMLLPPYALGLLAGGLSASVALRSRSPAAPLVTPVLAFAAVQVLGRQEQRWEVGLAFGVVACLWLLARGWRLEVRSRPAALLTRAGLSAGVLGLAVLLAQPVAGLVPVEEAPRTVLRDELPAYDLSKVTTPLSQFRRFTDQPEGLGDVHDAPLMTVTGLPAGSRLRFAALDTYDQLVFTAGDKTVPGRSDDRFLRINGEVENPAEGAEAFVNVEVHRAWDSPWLPTAGAVQWLGFEGQRSTLRRQAVRYNPATGTAVMTSELGDGERYEFATVLPDDKLSPWDQPYPEQDPALHAQARFVHVPAYGWAGPAATPVQAVLQAAEKLRATGRYSNGATELERRYGPHHDRVRLGPTFIYGSLTGDEEQYAPIMALAAVRLGVPARVVVGAVVPRSGVVRGRDVTAWVELRVADGTWRTLPTDRFMSRTPPEPDRFQENPDQSIRLPPGTKLPRLDLPDSEPTAKPPRPPRKEADLAEETSWWRPLLVALLVLALLVAVAVPVAKLVRRRRRLGHPRITRRYAGAWLELVDRARDLGVPVPHGLTRSAQATLMGLTGPDEDLAWEADRTIFGIDQPTAADAAAYWTAVAAALRTLRASRPWYRRLVAPLNPLSLRPRGGRNSPARWQELPREVARTPAVRDRSGPRVG